MRYSWFGELRELCGKLRTRGYFGVPHSCHYGVGFGGTTWTGWYDKERF